MSKETSEQEILPWIKSGITKKKKVVLPNVRGVNSPRRSNNSKYVCTSEFQYIMNSSFIKLKEIDKSTVITLDFNSPFNKIYSTSTKIQ